MADNKKQSMAGRVATPKLNPSKDVIDGDSVLYKAIGTRIKITCAPNNNVLEGILFTACNITHLLAINTAPPPPNPSASQASVPGDFHIIPFAHIVSFEVLGPGERVPESGSGFEGALPSISEVDLDAVRAREEQTIREMKKKDAQKGRGVTKEAQDIFDFIARTLPTRWAETQIIVNDAVVIESPYAYENIRAARGKEASLPHVRKIVERYYQLKKQVAPRKGG